MRSGLLLVLCLTWSTVACRTTGGGAGSETWASAENKAATVTYIKQVVIENISFIPPASPALQEFADALIAQSTVQIEPDHYVLKKYQDQRATQPTATNTELAAYIVEHFIAMTNFIAIAKGQTQDLKFVGLKGSI